MLKVLFLCTGNSARSQMAEALLRQHSKGRYEVKSAGSTPQLAINPYAKQVLMECDLFDETVDIEALVPKSIDSLGDEKFDIIITLCDKMHENCPVFPNRPIYAHWGMPDPAIVDSEDEETLNFFRKTLKEINNRINLFLCIDTRKADKSEIERELGEIAENWKYLR